jgi:hypothetical protein
MERSMLKEDIRWLEHISAQGEEEDKLFEENVEANAGSKTRNPNKKRTL